MTENRPFEMPLGPYPDLSDEVVNMAIDEQFGTHMAPETRDRMAQAIQRNHQYAQGCAEVQQAKEAGELPEGMAHFIIARVLPQPQNPAQFELPWQD